MKVFTLPCKLCERFWDAFWQSCDDWERERSNELHSFHTKRTRVGNSCSGRQSWKTEIRKLLSGSMSKLQMLVRYGAWKRLPFDTGRAPALARILRKLKITIAVLSREVLGWRASATLGYSRMLNGTMRQRVLIEGMPSGFVPFNFWLARHRYDRYKSRETAREVRFMLQCAAREGHLGAQQMLSRMMLTGKFGLLEIPRGMGMAVNGALKFASSTS